MELIKDDTAPSLKFERGEKVNGIRVSITEERCQTLAAGIFRTMGKDAESQFKFVAHFMTKPSGEFMTYEQACEVLDAISIFELGKVVGQIMDAVHETAVPNG